jgi:hypothetical protein
MVKAFLEPVKFVDVKGLRFLIGQCEACRVADIAGLFDTSDKDCCSFTR